MRSFFQAPASRAPLLSRARQVRSLVFRARRARASSCPVREPLALSFCLRPKVTGYRDVQPPSICGILRDNGAFRVRYFSGFSAIRRRRSLIYIWVFKKRTLNVNEVKFKTKRQALDDKTLTKNHKSLLRCGLFLEFGKFNKRGSANNYTKRKFVEKYSSIGLAILPLFLFFF